MTMNDNHTDTETAPDTDRPNAMLTKAQREFVTGKKEYSGEHAKQQRYQMRTAVRQRVRDTLLDFQLLFEHMDDRERERVFEVAPEQGVSPNREERRKQRALRYALADTLGFLYQGLEHTRYSFKHFLERGILQAVNKMAPEGQLVNAQTVFSVDIEPFPQADIESVAERIAEGNFDDLTEHELREYVKVTAGMDEFDREAVIEADFDRYGTGVGGPQSDRSPEDIDEGDNDGNDRQ